MKIQTFFLQGYLDKLFGSVTGQWYRSFSTNLNPSPFVLYYNYKIRNVTHNFEKCLYSFGFVKVFKIHCMWLNCINILQVFIQYLD